MIPLVGYVWKKRREEQREREREEGEVPLFTGTPSLPTPCKASAQELSIWTSMGGSLLVRTWNRHLWEAFRSAQACLLYLAGWEAYFCLMIQYVDTKLVTGVKKEKKKRERWREAWGFQRERKRRWREQGWVEPGMKIGIWSTTDWWQVCLLFDRQFSKTSDALEMSFTENIQSVKDIWWHWLQIHHQSD